MMQRLKQARSFVGSYWQWFGMLGLGGVGVITLTVSGLNPIHFLGAVDSSQGERVTQEVYGGNGQLVSSDTQVLTSEGSARHTLEFKIGGTNMQGIEIANMDLKEEDATSPKEVLKIDAGSKKIFVDKLILKNVHAAELTMEDSEVIELVVNGVRADGASTHVDVATAPLVHRGFRGYGSLPIWKVDASRYDVVEIEADEDAHVSSIVLENINIPGELSIRDIVANQVVIEDSTIGRGDGLENKDFVFDDVVVEVASIEGVVEAPVDNLLAPVVVP
ncbi:MAG: hypothetical protein A2748_02800 [Candidatus Wildermuthbacteria bacterium RIFCSPHIGHO2_01_FULL_45_20]|uniref:Uncharacterized protein n=1 Tax=Candidatus Wildermuthbacteria bacterium RIFCSPHIGHO2_02_FULL_45_25 TaxID=1802450 RepID=A0A1G2R5P1_9BACT|nr:MAG: hypothetical protein A2748_02800 [Candidatus Wildermuthbacteria bacterium RIFCSPHIGHO2_01_FULL_45_20]OHA67572.1 MAG: hypothetical protein A3C04_00940 [Candidatus Wildermuthbacteria bacterium RIFCSPHIGHO2_02_FULL_45_25]